MAPYGKSCKLLGIALSESKQLKCNSFEVVKKGVHDISTLLKPSFFSYYASLFQPFLVKYLPEKGSSLKYTKIL